MDDFQKQLQRLKRNPVFVKAFDKRRTEAEVAFQIRRLREVKGWTQKDLAKKVGCSQQAVSAVEQAGYKRHSLPLLRRIAAVLDADVVVALVPRKAALAPRLRDRAHRLAPASATVLDLTRLIDCYANSR